MEVVWKHEADKFYLVENINYKKLKLFALSTLWMMAVAKGNDQLKSVKLGPHEEIIRNMLLASNPGLSGQYGIVINKIIDDDSKEIILFNGIRGRAFGHNCYTMVFGGYLWNFFVTSHKIGEPVSSFLLREDGVAAIGMFKKTELGFLKAAAKILPLDQLYNL